MTGWPPVAISDKVSKGGELWVIWGYGIGVYQRERVTDWSCSHPSEGYMCIKCIGGIWVGFPSKMGSA